MTTYYEVGEVVLFVTVPVLFLFAIYRQCVVVVLRIPHLQMNSYRTVCDF